MSAKDVKFGDLARSQMLDGVNTLANAVTVSYTHLTLPTTVSV